MYWDSKNKNKKRKIDEEENDEELMDLSLVQLLSGLKKNSSESGENIVKANGNHIYLYSEIDRKTAYDVNHQIKSISNDLKTIKNLMTIPNNETQIYLHINSYGGSVFDALSIIDTIQNCNVPVYSIIEGCAASAATLISVVCNKRYITKNSYMLIHELRSGIWGKYSEIEEEYENLTSLMDTLFSIYQENTNIKNQKTLKNLLKKDSWWNAEICLKKGLVDEYWTEI